MASIDREAGGGRPLFEAASCSIVELRDPQDRDAVTELSANCADYAVMVTGLPPTLQDGEIFLTEAPPGHTLDTMMKLGIRDAQGGLIGVIDIVLDYPEPRIWYVGLLLIDVRRRGGGVGRAVMAGLAAFARRQGVNCMRLGVVEANRGALQFWSAIGFREVGLVADRRIGERDHTIIEFLRVL